MGRIDYLHDPDAPPANSVVPSVVAFVRNDEGAVLLIQRSDNGRWALPGGGHDVGESISDTVVREVWEETDIKAEGIDISGVYTDPGHVMLYDDGEARQQFSICFRARPSVVTFGRATKQLRSAGFPQRTCPRTTSTQPCGYVSSTPWTRRGRRPTSADA